MDRDEKVRVRIKDLGVEIDMFGCLKGDREIVFEIWLAPPSLRASNADIPSATYNCADTGKVAATNLR